MGPKKTLKFQHSKTEKQPMEWEKVFANDATDKGLIPKHTKCAYNSIKKKNQKMSRRPKQTSLHRRHTDGQQAHEKMIYIATYQRNANQNYNEVLPHSSQSDHH